MTLIWTSPLIPAGGVPVSVPLLESKLSQAGNGLPSAWVADNWITACGLVWAKVSMPTL